MNFLRRIISLCTSFRSYRNVRYASIGASLWHLGTVLLIASTVTVVSSLPGLWKAATRFIQWWEANAPAMEIRDGQIHSEVPQPFRVRYRDLECLLDTTGTVNGPDTNAVSGILFQAHHIVFWNVITNEAGPRLFQTQSDIKRFPDGPLNGDYIRARVVETLLLGAPLAVVVMLLVAMLTIMLQAYLFSVVAAFLDRSIGVGLSTAQYFNIALHAVTPAAIVVTVYVVMGLYQFLNIGWVYFLTYGLFLIGATNACRESASQDPQ